MSVHKSGIVVNSVDDGYSMFLPVDFYSVKSKFVIDTGSAVSFVSLGFYYSLPVSVRPELREVNKNLRFEVANDGLLEVCGVASFQFKLKNDVFKWDMFVAPIREDGLIGLDFLYEHEFSLGVRNGFRLNGKKYPTIMQKLPVAVSRVMSRTTVTIPSNNEKVIYGYSNAKSENANCRVIGPVKNSESEILVGNALVGPNLSDIPVLVMNLANDPIVVNAGQVIGQLDEVECVNDGENLAKINRVDKVSVHKHTQKWSDDLQNMYERACKNLSVNESSQLRKLLNKHVGVFAETSEDMGFTSLVQHTIDTGNAKPIKQRARRPPRAFANEEGTIIDSQLRAGVIQESNSPWASPLVYVRKRSGETRPCVDFRKLNDVTVKDAYPLPRINDCLDCLQNAKYFTTLDLQSGYWQISIHPDDRKKTAFVTQRGLYEYKTMPFGLCNAPSTFQRCMELVLRGLQWNTLLVYLDDIIIFSDSFEKHLDRLTEVFVRLQSAGLKLKPCKCELFQPEVHYLGFIVSGSGLSPDPEKIAAIREWNTPKCLTDVRTFLGLCSYYRRFIRDFSKRAHPLNRLLEAGRAFNWTEQCDDAFSDLKGALVGDEVMSYPNDSGMFILDTDASNTAIGAVLSQMQWCEKSGCVVEKPVFYASKSLTKSQRRYCVTRRELLAVVTFVHQFRHFLLGRDFLIRTDHGSLRWIMSFREPTDQTARWLEILSRFRFKIEHRAGRKHKNADALSRVPCDMSNCDCFDSANILSELPCGGCKTCKRKHEQWSAFMEESEVVPIQVRKITGRKNIRFRCTLLCLLATLLCFMTRIITNCCSAWIHICDSLAGRPTSVFLRRLRANPIPEINTNQQIRDPDSAASISANNTHSDKEVRVVNDSEDSGQVIQCNLSIPNLVYSEILFNPNKLFGPKVFYHLLHTKVPCVFRILYIPNSEHKIQSLEYIIA